MDREVTSSATFEASGESNDVVPKLPAKNERENDVVLGILFNGYVSSICNRIEKTISCS
jgi:hypothetical protein